VTSIFDLLIYNLLPQSLMFRHVSIKGVISEGQTTQTRLCSRTIVISENCLRSNRNVFEFCFTNNSHSCRSCFSCRERKQISICICIPRYMRV